MSSDPLDIKVEMDFALLRTPRTSTPMQNTSARCSRRTPSIAFFLSMANQLFYSEKNPTGGLERTRLGILAILILSQLMILFALISMSTPMFTIGWWLMTLFTSLIISVLIYSIALKLGTMSSASIIRPRRSRSPRISRRSPSAYETIAKDMLDNWYRY